MSEDLTIKLRDHDAAIIKYRRRGRGIELPSFAEFSENCDVREIRCLRDAAFFADVYPRMVVVAADSFRNRQTPLRILRSRIPSLPVVLFHEDNESFAVTLLEEEVVDAVLSAENSSALQHAVVGNLLERASRSHAQTERTELLSQKSECDSLTGLYNHGHLLEVLDSEFKRAERSGEKLSCVMLDIDFFKSINDTHGHRFGDHILREIADILRTCVRQTDIIGRYGGEEFMVVLPSTGGSGGVALAEKLRKVIEEHDFKHHYVQTLVTASFGVASNRDPGVISSERLLLASDRALYFAKESGRNRVCAAQQHPSLADFDLRRRQLVTADEHAPVVLLLTRNQGLRTRIDDLSETDGFQLISFESRGDFLQEFSALRPNLVVVDVAYSDYGEGLVPELASRTSSAQVPVLAIVDRQRPGHAADIGSLVDDVLMSDFETTELRKRLHNGLRISALQREGVRLREDLKASQRQMIRNERLRSVGSMAAGITHDFNNVLSSILGTTEDLMHLDGLGPDIGEKLETVRAAAVDGAATVRRLQSYLGPYEAREHGVHSLLKLVDESLHLTRAKWKDEALAEGRSYTIVNRIGPSFCVEGNASEYKEVFVNLITNAVDAMSEGGTLAFDARADENAVCISVQDTGHGMSREELKRIFDPLYTTKQAKGTGLGMQLVHSVLEHQGGRIEIDSTPGAGTTVSLHLPLAGELRADTGSIATPVPCGDEQQPPLRILIVDDEKAVREAYARMLQHLGHEVVSVAGGAVALVEVGQRQFDLIMTDLSMPDMSGWEVARRVHEVQPNAVIALMSGWGSDLDARQLAACSVSIILSKPCNFNDLKAAVSKIQNRCALMAPSPVPSTASG